MAQVKVGTAALMHQARRLTRAVASDHLRRRPSAPPSTLLVAASMPCNGHVLSSRYEVFPRNAIPWDPQAGGDVDPTTWGTPEANFQGVCDFVTEFGKQRILIGTTFCCDWAGALWDGEW
jgi:hypothetical protein